MSSRNYNKKPFHVGLLVTCLVNFFRPQIGFAAIKLLTDAGCQVTVPIAQTCCGQPAYNSGDRKNAKKIAMQVIRVFEEFDYVVAPSGSCASMMQKHFPKLFSDDAKMRKRANELASRVYELTSFLVDVLKIKTTNASYLHTVTYHDSCSGLRELGIRNQPRQLLNAVRGIVLTEMAESDVCCGFGGTFCVKYSEISDKIVAEKIKHIKETKANAVLAGDLGCLLNIEKSLQCNDCNVAVLHVAEVLAGMAGDK